MIQCFKEKLLLVVLTKTFLIRRPTTTENDLNQTILISLLLHCFVYYTEYLSKNYSDAVLVPSQKVNV